MPPNFLGGLRGLKLKDLPSYVNKHATENWTPGRVKERTMNFLHQYKEKYIDTGSVKPLFDTMAILFVSSYIIAYPHEVKHYKAEMQAKLDAQMGKDTTHAH